jgi:hypothetical protein
MTEHLEILAFTVPLCTSGDPATLSLGSSLDDHEIVSADGWISDDEGPQELMIDFLSSNVILHEISILVHEKYTPESITVLSKSSRKIVHIGRVSTLQDRGGNKRIREQISITLSPPQQHQQLRIIVQGPTRKGIVGLSLHGVPSDHHSRHGHQSISSRKKKNADTELHSLGLATISEAATTGASAGAHQILSNMDVATDTSTGMILDMLRKKKHDLIRAHTSSAEMSDAEANR